MTPDPYRRLNLPHSATDDEIKISYRVLARKYHPDRLMQQNLSEEEKHDATCKFVEIAGAYAVLSDKVKKAEYDHIYKYGGFDGEEEKSNSDRGLSVPSSTSQDIMDPSSSRKRSRGVGYTCHDPFAFLWSQGKVCSTKTVAGIQIPSRLQMNGGLRFAFSSGVISSTPAGTRKYTSKTIQFKQGKKYTRTETTFVYPNGRREIVVEGDDCETKRYSTPPTQMAQQQDEHSLPWYANAWHEVKDKIFMCYNPCAVVAQ